MAYTSMAAVGPLMPSRVNAYVDESDTTLAHVTLRREGPSDLVALILDRDECLTLIEDLRRAIREMHELASHPALRERD